jgi:hypothetical protein
MERRADGLGRLDDRLDLGNQEGGTSTQVRGVASNLRFADPLEARDAAIESLDQAIQIREHFFGGLDSTRVNGIHDRSLMAAVDRRRSGFQSWPQVSQRQ